MLAGGRRRGGPRGGDQAGGQHKVPVAAARGRQHLDWRGGMDRQSGEGGHRLRRMHLAGSDAALRQPRFHAADVRPHGGTDRAGSRGVGGRQGHGVPGCHHGRGGGISGRVGGEPRPGALDHLPGEPGGRGAQAPPPPLRGRRITTQGLAPLATGMPPLRGWACGNNKGLQFRCIHYYPEPGAMASGSGFFRNSGKLLLVPYTKDFGRITRF